MDIPNTAAGSGSYDGTAPPPFRDTPTSYRPGAKTKYQVPIFFGFFSTRGGDGRYRRNQRYRATGGGSSVTALDPDELPDG